MYSYLWNVEVRNNLELVEIVKVVAMTADIALKIVVDQYGKTDKGAKLSISVLNRECGVLI